MLTPKPTQVASAASVVVALLLAWVISGCSDSSRRFIPPPAPAPITVSGTVTNTHTGLPAATRYVDEDRTELITAITPN